MGRWGQAVLLAVLAPLSGYAAFADHFTPSFRASVDLAMKENDSAERARKLVDAMHSAKDDEVFFVLPLLFPPPMLDTAQKSGACVVEVGATASDVHAFVAGTEAEQKAFPTLHAAEIRPHVNSLIKCLCKYYKDGQLYFPGTQPNNSFKPNPLRSFKAPCGFLSGSA
jgi:hypothetical protein